MMKVLIATEKPFAPIAVNGIREIIQKAGFELALLENYKDKAELLSAVKDAHAVIIRSDLITQEVMEAAPNLKIVVRAGAGYDNVDLAAATKHGVVVMNTPGQNSNAVAELAIGMMLLKARNDYNGKAGTELKGKNIGIHAYGNVGRLVGHIAKGFGMHVFAYDPFVDKARIKSEGVTVVDTMEELYQNCQYISLHIPANDQTKKSINYDLLKKLPKNGTLVNTARKEVVDEAGLLKLMEERTDIFYLSDIAPDSKELFEQKFADRIFFTPKKMGAQTAEANINAGLAAANQIVGYLKEGIDTFKVN